MAILCNAECAKPTPKTVVSRSSACRHPTVAGAPKQLPDQSRRRATISVPFHFASAKLTEQAERVLRKEFAHWNAVDSIVIEGRTDDLGSQSFNDRLARNRAEAVAATLKQLGVTGEMTIQSQGKCCYATANRSEEIQGKKSSCRSANFYNSKGVSV